MKLHYRLLLACALPALLLLTGCRQDEYSAQTDTCLEFLYKYMTPKDDLLHTRDFWEENVRKTLQVRNVMEWNIPEREFLYFVLPLRSSNEEIDDFRTTYADTLCRRIKGMSLPEAAMEINHWVREQVIYDPKKIPAKSPMGTVVLGAGSCNEISDLTVCALRAAGIPARQVSVVWTNTSGAHSWVEVFSDGKWYCMGAGEPAITLGQGWFTQRASSVMLSQTVVFGIYDGPEKVLGSDGYVTAISNLPYYAPTKNLEIAVKDAEGKSVPNATVNFLVGHTQQKTSFFLTLTDTSGAVRLQTGRGDCAVTASADSLWGAVKVNACDTAATVVLGTTEEEARAAVRAMTLTAAPVTAPEWNFEAEPEYDEIKARTDRDDSIRQAKHAKDL